MKIIEDTICAIISPPGVGAINLIRISGKNSIDACNNIFKGKIDLLKAESNKIYYGKINNEIDDVLVSVFREPHSYTGEDSVEISCHGNPLISKKIIVLLLNQKVRLAEAGEFTKRAFMNGRLDLVQAEAVADLIKSRSDISLKGARNRLNGYLSEKLNKLKIDLVETAGLIELELDFSEEDLEFINKTKMVERVEKHINELNELINSFKIGKIIFEGINVAIIGKPNVGKSSVLNRLLKEDRAIVSDIPGTTRDVIKEEIQINGIAFRFFDTAGIRDSKNIIEEEGIKRAFQAIEDADIILLICDIFEHDFEKSNFNINTKNKTFIKILNKIDLLEKTDEDLLSNDYIKISAKTGTGFDLLTTAMINYAEQYGVYTENSSIIANERQKNCLIIARDSLIEVINSINCNLSGEYLSIDLRKSITALKDLLGEVTNDDILNQIFSKFCIGK